MGRYGLYIKPTINNMTRAELIAELQSKQDEVDGMKKQLGAITHAVVSNLRLTEKLISNVQESFPILEKGTNHIDKNPNVDKNGILTPRYIPMKYTGSFPISLIMDLQRKNLSLSHFDFEDDNLLTDDAGSQKVKIQLIQAVIAYIVFLILLTTISIIMANAR
jgi:hypothetical protein